MSGVKSLPERPLSFFMHALVCFQPGLLLGVAVDFALRQRLFQLGNLGLGEVGVVSDIQQS